MQLASAVIQIIALAYTSVPLMVNGLLVFHAGNAFYHPALSSLVPMVVSRDNLVKARAYLVKRFNRQGNLLDRCILLVIGVAAALFLMQIAKDETWVPIIGYAILGFTAGCTLPAFGAIPQLLVPEEFRGRYFAFQEMWHRITSQVALLLTGAMFDWIGMPSYLLMLSVVIFVSAIALGLVLRTSRAWVEAV